MAVYRITGQGTHGPLRPPYERGPRHFWNRHHTMPPAQNTIIVYESGLVIEGFDFPPRVQLDPSIYKIMHGGHIWTVDDVADPFLYDCMVVAGYDLVPEP